MNAALGVARLLALVLVLSVPAACSVRERAAAPAAASSGEGAIRLLVRGDDMGVAHAVNEACIRCYRDGIVRSVEVIVPGPWFKEAAKMLGENPGLDVGVHLDLTSEWEFYKWGPVSSDVPSLVDRQGKFLPMTRQRRDFPPGTGFLESGWKIEEVEKELRAQIELALESLPGVTHLSAHMGTATSTPELARLVDELAAEYALPIVLDGARRVDGFGGARTAAAKEAALIRILETLEPGLWIFVEHPGLDTPEMRAIGHHGYRDVAADRWGVTQAFTSDKVRVVIERRGIRLVSYADVLD